MMKKVSDICLDKIKEFEGLRKEAYYDAAGVPTIGYGHTHGVRMGDVISEYWAEMFLKADLYDVEKQVDSLGLDLNQPQFDALVSFAFNLGFYKLKAGGKKLRGLERRREWEARRFFEPDEMEPMKRRDWSDFHKEN